jgi:hypothetical protein
MTVKVENKSSLKFNSLRLIKHINSILDSVPQAHLRGITRVLLVDRIEDSRIDPIQRAELPGFYFPKLPGSLPWIEIAIEPLRLDKTWYRRLGKRLTFKANVTATLLSLIGQHYHLTLSHGVKKAQFERAVRVYTEKQISAYSSAQKGLRTYLLRPIQPALKKLARWARKRYTQEMAKRSDSYPKASKGVKQPRKRRK